ncbi:MAG: CdaR family protein [Defluviitaleaceae bacterium]|nr:CdaR family protein [Defluviitaleaceae bacterium]
MARIRQFFSWLFSDIHWKILSLLVALVLWFVGMNISDPYQNIHVTPRLQLDNIEILSHERIMVINEYALREMNIQVVVRGLRSDIDRLRGATPAQLAQILEVSIDFRTVDFDEVHETEGILTLPLRVSSNFLAAGFEHVSINPPEIEVQLDAISMENQQVVIVKQGTTSLNFEVQPISLANSRATMTGPRSILETVDSIRAHVDVTGIHGEEDVPVQLRVFDIYENDITNQIRLSVTETTATVRVWPMHQMDIRVRGVGSLASGTAVARVETIPTVARVVGTEDMLYQHEYILVEVDWAGASEDTVFRVDLTDSLPYGLYLYGDDSPEIDIYVTIEPIDTRTFNIPRGEVRTWGATALHEIIGQGSQILVSVSGPRSVISNMTAANVGLGLDLRGLPIGIHTVPLLVTLPSDVWLTTVAPVMMVQIHAPAVPSADDDYDDIPEPTPPPSWLPEYPDESDEVPIIDDENYPVYLDEDSEGELQDEDDDV